MAHKPAERQPQPTLQSHVPPEPPAPEPGAEVCRHCGGLDRPVLGPGRGPHACEAFCGHCGKHIWWVSLLAPSERIERRKKARRKAMQQLAPTAAQLNFLRELGDQGPIPEHMAEASERIARLKGA